MSQWTRAKVNIDYHVAPDNFYSVPYKLVHEVVEIRSTPTTVETLHKGQRVAFRLRGRGHGKHHGDMATGRKSHQAHLHWTPSRMLSAGAFARRQRSYSMRCAATFATRSTSTKGEGEQTDMLQQPLIDKFLARAPQIGLACWWVSMYAWKISVTAPCVPWTKLDPLVDSGIEGYSVYYRGALCYFAISASREFMAASEQCSRDILSRESEAVTMFPSINSHSERQYISTSRDSNVLPSVEHVRDR